MAEWGMAQIVAQCDGLGQILIEMESLGNGPCNLRDLKGMGQPRSVMVPRRNEKHLRLMLQPSKRFRVDDPIPIVLKGWSEGTFLLEDGSPLRL
jgi:hypothetical protein